VYKTVQIKKKAASGGSAVVDDDDNSRKATPINSKRAKKHSRDYGADDDSQVEVNSQGEVDGEG